MLYLISTYKRTKQYTIELLLGLGVAPRDVIVGTQRMEDFAYIKERYGGLGVRVILSEAKNVAGNRNALLEYARAMGSEFAFCLDDDLFDFNAENISFQKAVETSVAEMKRLSLSLLEWDSYWMDRDRLFKDIWLGWAYCGMAIMVTTDIKFDETFNVSEDIELQLRLISEGRNIGYTTAFRMIGEVSGNTHTKKIEGGCSEYYDEHNKYLIEQMTRVAKMYPRFLSLVKIVGTECQ